MKIYRGSSVLFIAVCMSIISGNVFSEEPYPHRPITVVVPWTAGMLDTVTRMICKPAEKELGQPIIIENKPGGAGVVGLN